MEIILIEDVPHLGDMGDVVVVKPGYARNYLIPQKLALRASKGNKAHFEHQRRVIETRKEKLRAAAVELQQAIAGVSVILPRKAGENDKLYGSITKRDITTALAEAGHQVDPKKVILDNPLRELGIYKVMIKLHADVVADVVVWVVAI